MHLPLAECDANRNHDAGCKKWNPPKAEPDSHYNVTLFNTHTSADKFISGQTDSIMKTIVAIIAFTLILGSLGFALFFLMKDKGKSNRTVNALAFRVGFSIALFLLLLLAYHFGLIQPTGIRL
jgi:hypothetical protein